MAAGLPVVTTRVGALPTLVGNHAGRTVRVGDAVALEKALLELLGDASLRARLGDHGFGQVTTEYSATRMARDFLGVYQELSAGGAA